MRKSKQDTGGAQAGGLEFAKGGGRPEAGRVLTMGRGDGGGSGRRRWRWGVGGEREDRPEGQSGGEINWKERERKGTGWHGDDGQLSGGAHGRGVV